MKYSIDLNCDLGEGFASDAAIIPHATSVNIACGYHAGDEATMRKSIRLAIDHGVAIGAHPGLPDRVNFGRWVIQVTWQEVYDMVLAQVGTLSDFARDAGASVTHLKPHGALYSMGAKDAAFASAIVAATLAFDRNCILVGRSGSELIKAGESGGLRTVSEAFADRTYQADGSLTSRDLPDALIHDPVFAAERVLQMVRQGTVTSQQGTEVPLRAETICIHGDSPGAANLAQTIRERLKWEGIKVRPFAHLPGDGAAKP